MEKGFVKDKDKGDDPEDKKTMDLSHEDKNNQKRTNLTGQMKLKLGLILIGVAILGVATGMFIMNIKVKELKLQNEELSADLKSQEERADGLELENGKLGTKFERIKPYMKSTFDVKAQIGKNSYFKSTQIGGKFLLGASGNKNDIQGVQDLLELGSDVNAKDDYTWTSLHLAAWNGNLEVAKLLVQHGAEIDAKTNYTGIGIFVDFDETMNDLTQGLNQSTPLHFAARNGHLEIVKLLIQHGANLTATNVYYDNDWKHTPADLAAQKGHFEVVDFLLQTEWTNNGLPGYLRILPSLSIAACFGYLEILDLMLQNGYDVNIESQYNHETPLHIAAQSEKFEIAKFLLQNNADANAKTGYDLTPLHQVALNGDFEIAELLLQNGAEVDAKSKDKETPLHTASDMAYPKVVEVLLKYGARKDLKDSSGKTPLDLARGGLANGRFFEEGSIDYQEIIELLKTD